MTKKSHSTDQPVGPKLIGDLFDKHANALVLYARQLCNEPTDVVQQAFIKLAGQRSAPNDALAWLYRVVRNEAYMVARSSRRRQKYEAEATQNQVPWFSCTADDSIDSKVVVEALCTLPDDLREIVVAHLWLGQTFQQISLATGISSSTVHRRYQEAIRNLRERVHPHER